jgi:SAM-dependent methyltransferase
MENYGAEFSAVFSAKWDLWGRQAWSLVAPYLPSTVRGRSWLDLCCGAGTLLQLASAGGFDVTGVDRSSHQLGHAAQKAPNARLIQADIRDLAIPERFDVVTCMFDSLNYLLRLADIDQTIRVVKRHLKPDGVFIFDVKTSEGFRAERTRVFKWPEQVVVFEREFDDSNGIHRFAVTGFTAEGRLYKRFEERHVQRAYEADTVTERLEKRGCDTLCLDFDTAKKAGRRARRLLFVCTIAGSRQSR